MKRKKTTFRVFFHLNDIHTDRVPVLCDVTRLSLPILSSLLKIDKIVAVRINGYKKYFLEKYGSGRVYSLSLCKMNKTDE